MNECSKCGTEKKRAVRQARLSRARCPRCHAERLALWKADPAARRRATKAARREAEQ